MRFVERSEAVEPLKRTEDGDVRLSRWLSLELLDAIGKRYWQDLAWRENMRMYEAIPPLGKGRSRPYQENFLLEVPLGATRADELESQIIDLIFNQADVYSVHASPGFEDHAYAAQLLVNKFVEDRFTNLRCAAESVIADTVQLGTGTYYNVRSEEVVRSGAVSVINRGPRVYSIPTEDIIVPGAAYSDPDYIRYISYRMYLNQAEIDERARQLDWNTDGILPATNISWVRLRREEVARTSEPLTSPGDLYEIHQVYCYFDYDGKGSPQDLLATFEPSSQRLLAVQYNPYDARPFVISRYQARPHLFYGLGVLEMCRPFEEEVTELFNFGMANAHLANTRYATYRLGSTIGDNIKLAPNTPLGLANPKEDLIFNQAGDIYPSLQQYIAVTEMLADRRVGTSQSAAGPHKLGGRTPATTAMSLLQAQNRRFASPFNNIRYALADTATQLIMRLKEQYVRGGDDQQSVMKYLIKAIGAKHTSRILELFEEDDSAISDHVVIEITASSASVNREADKQSSVMMMQVLDNYYNQLMQAAQALQAPPEIMQKLVLMMAEKKRAAMATLLQTFDTVRDPDKYLIKVEEVLGGGGASQNPAQGQPAATAQMAPGAQGAPAEQPGTGGAGPSGPPSGPVI